MATSGQKFTLNLDSDNYTFDVQDEDGDDTQTPHSSVDVIGGIHERETISVPQPPKFKPQVRSGFPEHRKRHNESRFKQQGQKLPPSFAINEPSDRAINHHIGKKYGIDTEAKEKAEISEENRKRLANMSAEDIAEARAELMSNLNPAFLERLMRRAKIEQEESVPADCNIETSDSQQIETQTEIPDQTQHKKVIDAQQEADHLGDKVQDVSVEKSPDANMHTQAQVHFPIPPRDASEYTALDPNSSTFLTDLQKHYFPSMPHDTSSLAWLRDTTEEEKAASAYAPTQLRYAPSDIRFNFTGRLIPPSESATIPVDQGLHHHGEAPDSAGYTIPELSMLVRSTLPNQRCMAYQMLGRILYKLGHGDFGQRGSELVEGLWGCIEHERPVEVMMAEANRLNGHVSAKAYATEALWLWRKGGGGDRGVLKTSAKIAK